MHARKYTHTHTHAKHVHTQLVTGPFLQPHPLLQLLHTPSELLSLRQKALQLLHQLPPLECRRAAAAAAKCSAPSIRDARNPPHTTPPLKGAANAAARVAGSVASSSAAPTRVNPPRSAANRAQVRKEAWDNYCV